MHLHFRGTEKQNNPQQLDQPTLNRCKNASRTGKSVQIKKTFAPETALYYGSSPRRTEISQNGTKNSAQPPHAQKSLETWKRRFTQAPSRLHYSRSHCWGRGQNCRRLRQKFSYSCTKRTEQQATGASSTARKAFCGNFELKPQRKKVALLTSIKFVRYVSVVQYAQNMSTDKCLLATDTGSKFNNRSFVQSIWTSQARSLSKS